MMVGNMGSSSKRALKQRVSSTCVDVDGDVADDESPSPSFTATLRRKPPADHVLKVAATTDSYSRGNDNSEASDSDSDCMYAHPSEWDVEDEILGQSCVLTLDEVLQRRVKRIRKLMTLYKSQYWGLLEETRTKYRRFYLRHGKSGWREDVEKDLKPGSTRGKTLNDAGDGMREPDIGKTEDLHCGAQGCSAKPLPLSVFCVAHILLEPRQRLYKPCSYTFRMGQSGPIPCGRPVLRAAVPLLCGEHFQVVRKQANRSLSKVLPGFKSNPKLHVIIAQYVGLIQSKRRISEENAKTSAHSERGQVLSHRKFDKE